MKNEIKIHELKIWPEFYDDVEKGIKLSELRVNDRDYQPGDVIKFQEWSPDTKEYTERETYKVVQHVIRINEMGEDIKKGLGLNPSMAPVNKLAILSINEMSIEVSAALTMQEMRARPLHVEELGEPDFESRFNLAAHIYELKPSKEILSKGALMKAYLIVSNTFHVGWTQWVCTMVSLRERKGLPKAKKQFPEAEYEMIVQAVSPDTPILIRETDFSGISFYASLESVVQFHGTGNGQANELVAGMMQLIADGRISPDADYRGSWTQEVQRMAHEMRRGAESGSVH